MRKPKNTTAAESLSTTESATKVWASLLNSEAVLMLDSNATEASIFSWLLGIDDEEMMIEADGTAIINVRGPIIDEDGWYGVSYQNIANMIAKADADESVTGIFMRVNSPGGVAEGMAAFMRSMRMRTSGKPIVAWGPYFVSASYGIASIADEMYGTDTGSYGSIGVRISHVSRKEWLKKNGYEFTHITAGKYKADGNFDEPLTDTAKNRLQKIVNKTWDIFVNEVSQERPLSIDDLYNLEAQVYQGSDAIDKRLIDGVMDEPEARDRLRKLMETRGMKNISAKLGLAAESVDEASILKALDDVLKAKSDADAKITELNTKADSLNAKVDADVKFASIVCAKLKAEDRDAALVAIDAMSAGVDTLVSITGATDAKSALECVRDIQSKLGAEKNALVQSKIDGLIKLATDSGVYNKPVQEYIAGIKADTSNDMDAQHAKISAFVSTLVSLNGEKKAGVNLAPPAAPPATPSSGIKMVSMKDILAMNAKDAQEIYDAINASDPSILTKMKADQSAKFQIVV